jgi:hypothetical protein
MYVTANDEEAARDIATIAEPRRRMISPSVKTNRRERLAHRRSALSKRQNDRRLTAGEVAWVGFVKKQPDRDKNRLSQRGVASQGSDQRSRRKTSPSHFEVDCNVCSGLVYAIHAGDEFGPDKSRPDNQRCAIWIAKAQAKFGRAFATQPRLRRCGK